VGGGRWVVLLFPRFNGAADGDPRKVAPACCPCSTRARFNGAADGDPRKAESARVWISIIDELQWGRGWGSAERVARIWQMLLRLTLQWSRGWGSAERDCVSLGTRRYNIRASMGPRMGIRGKHRRPGHDDLPSPASMGPRMGIRGKHRRPGHDDLPSPASMGPRMGIRGKFKVPESSPQAYLASMGPRMEIRGKGDGEHSYEAVWGASMGPRMGIRGKITGRPRCTPTGWLQWGRGWGSAES